MRAGDIEPVPADLPLIFGDAYFNLRAALDFLVYQMHVRHYRGHANLPAAIAGDSAFPIRDRQPTSPTSAWPSIRNLSARERASIEWIQPYQRRGRAFIKDIRSALADIARLNNVDKHRDHIAWIKVFAVQAPRFAPEFGFRQNPAFGVALETGAYIDTWTFTSAPPPEQMDFEPVFRTAIGIEPGGDVIEAIAHLGGCIHAVKWIITERFGHLFAPLAEPLDLSWVRMDEAPY